MLKTPLGRVRLVGFIEGISFLVLLGIAMPLKYIADMPLAVTIVGTIHGILFVLYIVAIAQARSVLNWTWARTVGALAASVLPFGPFVLDARLRRDEREKRDTAVVPSGK